MIKHIWSVLCRRSVIDKDTNTISLYDCLEEIYLFPKDKIKDNTKQLIPINFEIVSFWVKEKNINKSINFEIKIEIFSPENKKLGFFYQKVIIPEKKERMRTRIHVKVLPFTSNGKYTIRIILKKNKKEPRTGDRRGRMGD